MSTNSADPIRLHGYAIDLHHLTLHTRPAQGAARAAVAQHNAASPGYPVDLGAVLAAGRILADLDRLAARVDSIGSAFAIADHCRSALGRVVASSDPDLADVFGRLARGETIGGSNQWGWHRQGSVGAEAGSARYRAGGSLLAGAEETHRAKASFGRNGADLEVGITAFAGVRSQGEVQVGVGPVSARVSGDARAGVSAQASGRAHIGPDGVGAHGEAGVFVGVSATAGADATIGPVEARARGGAVAGVAARAEGDVSLSWDGLHIEGAAELAVLFGFSGEVDVTIDPRKAAELAARGGELAVDGIEKGVEVLGDGIEGFGEGIQTVGRGVEALGDGIGDVAGSIGAAFSRTGTISFSIDPEILDTAARGTHR